MNEKYIVKIESTCGSIDSVVGFTKLEAKEFVKRFTQHYNPNVRKIFVEKENNMKLKFKKLTSNAILPKYVHSGDSGMDICAIEDCTIPPHSFRKVNSGIAAVLPYGFELQVRPRSGLSAKHGVFCSWGTVDSGYRGDIGITLYNESDVPYEVKAGDRVAQLVLSPVMIADIEETDTLDITERGQNGFGSTGR